MNDIYCFNILCCLFYNNKLIDLMDFFFYFFFRLFKNDCIYFLYSFSEVFYIDEFNMFNFF